MADSVTAPKPSVVAAPVKKSKPTETKRARFLRIATMRVRKALPAIARIANCAGNGYEWTEADAAKINAALIDAVANVKLAFSPKSSAAAAGFGL